MAIQPKVLFSLLKEDLSDTFGPSFLKDCEGEMWPDMTPRQAAGYSIYHSFLKKLETGRTKITDQKALDKFLACNNACEEWSLPSQYDSRIETLLGEVRRAVHKFWFKDGEPILEHPFELLEKGGIGPGVSVGSEGNSFYAKLFSSRLTCSDSSLYNWYRRYISSFPEWSNAENIRIENYGSASVVASNRLSFVPKNDEISRCICIEPTLDTIFQSGIGRILESRLAERFGISLESQQFDNRNLARFGSLDDDISTIDLSSASDSISLKMLKWLLPESFYKQLVKYRSSSTEIKGRGTVPLYMVSTMGNGYTFPLQTMIFACVVVAAFRFRGIPDSVGGTRWTWGINGDDIACPSLITKDVIDLLNILGFRVNDDKTFVEGPFRESCGHDYHLGYNVRGVYVKTLKTPASRYSVINLLRQFSTRTGICLDKTVNALLNSVKFLPVPPWENMDSGIHSTLHEARPYLIWDKDCQAFQYTCLVSIPRVVRFKEGRVVVPRSCKQLIYNPSGLLISFLQRSINGGCAGVREDFVRYSTKRRITSFWDNPLPDPRFKTANDRVAEWIKNPFSRGSPVRYRCYSTAERW